MTNYKSMYYKLFNRISDAIEVLQAAQQEGENAYIEDNVNAEAQPPKKESDPQP